MDAALPMHLLVGAAQRAALEAGVGFYVRRRGEPGRGTLLLIVNDRAGTSRLYRQIWDGQHQQLVEIESGEAAVEAAVVREQAFDPDLWVVEIEDREARLFFDELFSMNDTI